MPGKVNAVRAGKSGRHPQGEVGMDPDGSVLVVPEGRQTMEHPFKECLAWQGAVEGRKRDFRKEREQGPRL